MTDANAVQISADALAQMLREVAVQRSLRERRCVGKLAQRQALCEAGVDHAKGAIDTLGFVTGRPSRLPFIERSGRGERRGVPVREFAQDVQHGAQAFSG